MAIQPTVFERTHSGGKEPTRYFTPTAVGSHFGRSASSILHDFQSGKVQSLEAGPYRYKPVASRPGPMASMTKESGLDRMTEPYQEARKSEMEEKIGETAADYHPGRAKGTKPGGLYLNGKEVTPEEFKAATQPKEKPVKEAAGEKYYDYVGRGRAWRDAKSAEEWEQNRQAVIKNEKIASEGIHTKGTEEQPDIKEAAKSAKLDLTPAQKAEGAMAMVAAKRLAKEDPKNLTRDQIADQRSPGYEAAKNERKYGPIKKAADDFSREEWTGMKPLDKPAPDREKFLATGEVSPEAKQKQGWWDRMKERLRFARAEDSDEKKLAKEKEEQYTERQQKLESLPGYDDWKLSNREDERLRRRPIKKSAEEGEMEQSGGAHIDAGHVDINVKKAAKSDKFERCVHEVKRKDGSVNPWAVCHASTGE